jgi:hypothetical protein
MMSGVSPEVLELLKHPVMLVLDGRLIAANAAAGAPPPGAALSEHIPGGSTRHLRAEYRAGERSLRGGWQRRGDIDVFEGRVVQPSPLDRVAIHSAYVSRPSLFVGRLLHDINNQLTVMDANLMGLSFDLGRGSEEVQSCLKDCQQASRNIARLIQQLRGPRPNEAELREELDLMELLCWAVDLLWEQLPDCPPLHLEGPMGCRLRATPAALVGLLLGSLGHLCLRRGTDATLCVELSSQRQYHVLEMRWSRPLGEDEPSPLLGQAELWAPALGAELERRTGGGLRVRLPMGLIGSA